jgi:hypothetical protein
MLMMVKVKFEGHNKTFEMCITDNDSINLAEQQKSFLEHTDYESLETRMMHHLYNPETNMFILSASELKPRKNKNFIIINSKIFKILLI